MRKKNEHEHDGKPVVTDTPPANPFGEPVKKPEAYDDGKDAEVNQATTKPAETMVEYPLSPTDTNPNPHGTRDEPFTAVVTKDGSGGTITTAPQEGEVTIEAVHGENEAPIHLGDGRTLHHGGKAHVTKEIADDLVHQKKAKRVRG